MRLTKNQLRRVIRKILKEASEIHDGEHHDDYDEYSREMRRYQKPERESLKAKEAEAAASREEERREEELSIHRRHFDRMSQEQERHPYGSE